MLVWRAGACSHDGLAFQTVLHGSLGCHATPVLAVCSAQLMTVRLQRLAPRVAPLVCSQMSQRQPLPFLQRRVPHLSP